MFRKLLINGTKLQNAWAFIVCYITECFEDYEDRDIEITENVIWNIIETAYKDSKEFKEAYDYWVNKTNIIQAEDTLVLQLVVRTRCIHSKKHKSIKDVFHLPDPLDYMEVIQFGKKLEYDV